MKSFLAAALMSLTFSSFASEIKILSWNVFMIPKPIRYSFQSERTVEIIKELDKGDYDVVFLQEAFMASFRDSVVKSLSRKYPFAHYLGIKGPLPLVGSGVFVLSKYPYKVMENIHFQDCSGADCLSSKGATFLELTLPGNERMQFGVTHMQAGAGVKKEVIRLAQLKQIRLSFDKIRKASIPQLLIGDVNIDYNNNREEFDRMSSFLKMTTEPLSGDLTYTGGFPAPCLKRNGNSRKWIDHVLLSQEARQVSVTRQVRAFKTLMRGQECPLSDHYAVEAKIRVRPTLSPLKLAGPTE